MPEGPEIRRYFLYINPLLIDSTIKRINVLSGKYLNKTPIKNLEKVKDILIKKCFVKGKTIFIEFESELVKGMSFVHGMTGYWSEKLEKHSRLYIELNETKFLYYNDPRNFGIIKVYETEGEFKDAQDQLGPYVLDELTYSQFWSRFNKKKRSKLGTVLLDQKVVSGIGNYLRCDILWYVRKICGYNSVTHNRLIGSLTEDEKRCLHNVTINICRYRAELPYNLEFPLEDFYVYNQKYDIYGNEVIRENFGGRTIHYVLN